MPPLVEQDLLYMPSALPGLSAEKASQLLQQTDYILMRFREGDRVFGKVDRAERDREASPSWARCRLR